MAHRTHPRRRAPGGLFDRNAGCPLLVSGSTVLEYTGAVRVDGRGAGFARNTGRAPQPGIGTRGSFQATRARRADAQRGTRMSARPVQAGGDRNLRAGGNKPGLLTLTIKDKSALYLAYMPFVKNGGLFIPTNSNYRLGDEVFMLLNLMGEDEKLPVAGRVIWVTPKGAQGNQGKRTAGIGVQFSEQDRGQTQKKIETYLAGALSGDKATHTM